MEPLFGKTLEELEQVAADLQLPGFAAKQIADWLYKKRIGSIEDMTNLSKQARSKLKTNYQVGLSPARNVQVSADGTKKYLFNTSLEKFIETAYIPDNEQAYRMCIDTGGMQNGVSVLHDRQAGVPGKPVSRGDSESAPKH